MGLLFWFLLLFCIVLFYKLNYVRLTDPVSIVLLLHIFLPFVLYPIVFSFTFDSFNAILEYFENIKISMLIILVIFMFWALGFMMSVKKGGFSLDKFRIKKRDKLFAFFLYSFGVLVFFLTFRLAGISFLSSFDDPLGTRFQIINTAGGFHLRNVALWSMWSGWFLLLVIRLQGYSISKGALVFLFCFVIFLSIPLGQRYQLVFPFIFLILLLKYRGIISDMTIYVSSLILVIIVPLLALYRELGKSMSGVNSDDFFSNLSVIFGERSKILTTLVERYESISWFNKFWLIRDDLIMTFSDSFKGLLSLFIPSSFTGGSKGLDVEGFLTMKIVGSQDFGTFSFTSFPEWYLNFGYLGFPVMALLSGLVVGKIVNSVSKLGINIFYLALFADGFFLKLPFLNLNFNSNVSVLYHWIFACVIYFLYKVYDSFFSLRGADGLNEIV